MGGGGRGEERERWGGGVGESNGKKQLIITVIRLLTCTQTNI